jgi:hypothetical protein
MLVVLKVDNVTFAAETLSSRLANNMCVSSTLNRIIALQCYFVNNMSTELNRRKLK